MRLLIQSAMRSREQITYRLDTLRASTDGVLEALVQTVLLLVAIRYFAAADWLRSLIAMSRYLGFICSLFYNCAYLKGTIQNIIFGRLPDVCRRRSSYSGIQSKYPRIIRGTIGVGGHGDIGKTALLHQNI